MQLMGWHAEPQLLRRLKVYIVEGLCEAVGLIIGMHISSEHLRPPGLFVRLLVMPLVVVLIRILWASRLVHGYRQVKNADMGTIINMMSSVHTRDCWSCSTATFTCLSCVLMVWYGILFLLLGSYEGESQDEIASRVMLTVTGLGAISNWAFWRDFVRNFKDTPPEPDDLHLLYKICGMYWSDVIKLVRFGEERGAAASDSKAGSESETPQQPLPDTCAVCLEDYKVGEVLAQLPCGHVFHPTCANKWLREDWRCPLRCNLKPKIRAWEAAEADATQIDDADLEAARVSAS